MKPSVPQKVRAHARRKARRALVQAMYQWQLNNRGIKRLLAEFHKSKALAAADRHFFDDVLYMTTEQVESLDGAFGGFLDRDLEALNHVELAIMRLGACELLNRPDVPYRVIINEYVDLAHLFGAEKSFKYVNGVLDQIAKKVRAGERNADS